MNEESKSGSRSGPRDLARKLKSIVCQMMGESGERRTAVEREGDIRGETRTNPYSRNNTCKHSN